MRRRLLTVPLLLALASTAAGAEGYLLEEELTRAGADGKLERETSRTWIVEGSLRKEQSPSGSITIVRQDLGAMWVLDSRKRTYFVLKRGELDQLGQLGMSLILHGDEDPKDWLRKTGNRKRFGTWDAYEVRMVDRPIPGATVSLWLSPDVPIDKSFRDQFGFGAFGDANPAARLLAGLRDLEGYPVEVSLVVKLVGQTMEIRQRLKSVTKTEIDPKTFELPPGYQAVPNPFAELVPAQ